jgi:hypothetical protein
LQKSKADTQKIGKDKYTRADFLLVIIPNKWPLSEIRKIHSVNFSYMILKCFFLQFGGSYLIEASFNKMWKFSVRRKKMRNCAWNINEILLCICSNTVVSPWKENCQSQNPYCGQGTFMYVPLLNSC